MLSFYVIMPCLRWNWLFILTKMFAIFLKGPSHEIFDLRFFSSNNSIWTLDPRVKAFLHMASCSRRYSTKKSIFCGQRCQWHRCSLVNCKMPVFLINIAKKIDNVRERNNSISWFRSIFRLPHSFNLITEILKGLFAYDPFFLFRTICHPRKESLKDLVIWSWTSGRSNNQFYTYILYLFICFFVDW
jgi:hypothetical protein